MENKGYKSKNYKQGENFKNGRKFEPVDSRNFHGEKKNGGKVNKNSGDIMLSCPVARRCSGCQLDNMGYRQQLKWKYVFVERLLSKYCGVSPILGMENPFNYRNKVQALFRMDQRKKIVSGVYQSSTDRVVPVDSCMLEDNLADEIIVGIRNMLPSFKLQPYDTRTERGFLRHVLVKRGFTSGEVMVVLVTPTPMFPSKNNFVKVLRQKFPEITTVVQNISPDDENLVLGERENVLFGKGFIEDELCGCVFRISPRSFYQINPVQTEVLYGKAIELAKLDSSHRVVDAYCGIGTIGLIASKHCKEVIGVEQNKDAVRDAISNCKRNKITNARFYKGDAGEFMTEMAEAGESADVVFMDPPRAGSDTAFLTSVVTLAPKKVVYISCNPETLARDLEFLTNNKYKVECVHPVDMFPFTKHVECVCLLKKI